MKGGDDNPGAILGRYTLHDAIASGSMGTVYLGRDEEAGAVVAIKRLHPHLAGDPALVTTFLEAAERAARLAHECVVRVLETASSSDGVFVVMEYVPGESLARLVRGRRPPSYRGTVTIVRDALFGLQSAHEAGLFHRDVSPENVLVGTDGVSRLADFGVAQAVSGAAATVPERKGKLVYLAPEHLRTGEVSVRTDLYAMGVVLWELVTGKRLFKGERSAVVVSRIMEGEAPGLMGVVLAATARKLPDVALPVLERLDRIVMRAVSIDPEERYASAQEMALDVALALDPATREDVGAWVEKIAHDVLAPRAARVAEILEGPAEPEPESVTLVNDDALALLPIIVADLADAGAVAELTAIAEARGIALVPLMNAPGDATDHVLEVLVPGQERPALFVARPMGPPTGGAFPLALRPHGAARTLSPLRADVSTGRFTARTESRRELSVGHTKDLTSSRSGPGEVIELTVLGRTLSVQGGQVVLEERLGSGGGGAVYRARYMDPNRRDVAVKVEHFRPDRDLELCARFHAEALAASKLDHKNLVRVIDFGQEPDGLFHLTMEYLQGPSLREVLEEDGPLPVERAVKIMMQVCAGLAHAHRRGVVHRDVKPSNVILVSQKDDDGHRVKVAKVVDFGLAAGPAVAGEAERGILGTPQYMSPEQCRGGDVDARSDIYSCGVMLYELVTGRLPFEGRDARELLRLHQLAAPTPPSSYLADIDPLLEKIIVKALEKSPDARFASMLDLRAALKEVVEPTLSPDMRPSALPPRISGRPSSLPMPSAPPVADDAPIAASLEGLAALLRSLAEMPQASSARLAEIERKTASLELVLQSLAARGDAVALVEVIKVVTALQDEAARASSAETWTGAAASCAQRLLHTVADPVALVPAAEKLLSAREEPTEAQLSLLVWAKVPGAYALFSARLRLESPAARTRFVSAMRLIGAAAVPVMGGALGRMCPSEGGPIENPPLAVDLLRSFPAVRDDSQGSIIARYARARDPEIQRAALSLLVHVWGERASSALLAGMQSTDDQVQILAVRGLKTIGAIDELVVRKIDFMIGEGQGISDDLRVAAAEALSYATIDARAIAGRVAARFLVEGSPLSTNAGAIAFARAALALAPNDARRAIEARAARGPDALRGALLALLG
ncbi:MAG: protein kinase [Deltaproteobacteria bacterium]|nr:protein kinase [Deltaproteobacteria bacterium]